MKKHPAKTPETLQAASDPSTPPDVLARLSFQYPAEVAANPSALPGTLLQPAILRSYLPSVYNNPMWLLFSLESPKEWLEVYRRLLDEAWVTNARIRLSNVDAVRLVLDFLDRNLRFTSQDCATFMRGAIARIRAGGPWSVEREHADLRIKNLRAFTPDWSAYVALQHVFDMQEAAHWIAKIPAPESSDPTVALHELHWFAMQCRAAMGYADSSSVGGVRDNPEDEPPYEQYDQDDIRTLAEDDLLAALGHPNAEQETLLGLLRLDVSDRSERLVAQDQHQQNYEFWCDVLRAVSGNPALAMLWLEKPPANNDELLTMLWDGIRIALQELITYRLSVEVTQSQRANWMADLCAKTAQEEGIPELLPLIRLARSGAGKPDLNKLIVPREFDHEALIMLVHELFFAIQENDYDSTGSFVQQYNHYIWAKNKQVPEHWRRWRVCYDALLKLLPTLEA